MKKKAIILCSLIALLLVIMHLPQAYLTSYSDGPNQIVYYTKLGTYPYSFAVGHVWTSCSFFLALLALVFALCSWKRRRCSILCGFLLLLSAGAVFYGGEKTQFHYYTQLTWGIFAALLLLGLWAIFAFRKKPQAQSAEASAETAN